MHKNLLIILFIMLVLVANSTQAMNDIPAKKNSVTFIENKGQWDHDILYLSQLRNLSIGVTFDGVIYDYYKLTNDNGKTIRTGHSFKMKFKNTQDFINFKGLNQSSEIKNYFIGNDQSKWIKNVTSFSNIHITDIYDGIDLLLYDFNGMPRYDFIVKKNADPRTINLEFEGISEYEITGDGNSLTLKTSIGEILNSDLFAYQLIDGKKVAVDCKFSNENGKLGFEIGKYDTDQELIIDPIIYTSYFGGSDEDAIVDVKYISDDVFVVTGWSESNEIYTTSGAYSTEVSVGKDIFITKFKWENTVYSPTISTIVAGAGDDIVTGIDVDNKGNIFIGGYTNSSDFPIFSPFQNDYLGENEIFVTKLAADLSELVYSTYIGGGKDDFAHDLKVNSDGHAFLAGQTYSTDFPTTASAIQDRINGTSDAFVFCLSESGRSLDFCTYFGGTQDDVVYGIDLDLSDAVYMTGKTNSADFPKFPYKTWRNNIIEAPYDHTYNGGWDAFVCQLIGNGGKFEYSSYFGGFNDDVGKSITFIGNGAIIFAGETVKETTNASFPVTGMPYQGEHAGSVDVFIAKFNRLEMQQRWGREVKTMPLIFSGFLGGSKDETVNDIKVNPKSSSFYVVGSTNSKSFPIENDFKSKYSGGTDIFYTEFISSGTDVEVSSLFGKGRNELAGGFDVDGFNGILIGGQTGSDDIVVSDDAHQNGFGGMSDGFILKNGYGALNVSYPRYGQDFCVDLDLRIEFTRTTIGEIEPIRIELGRTSTNEFVVLEEAFTESELHWTIPLDMVQADDYVIRISHISGIKYTMEEPFSISLPPSINSIDFDTENTTICEGESFTISVDAGGKDLEYQWLKNDWDIAGATESTLLVENADASNSGLYSVVVSGKCDPETESEGVQFLVQEGTEITAQPEDITVVESDRIEITVEAIGVNLEYQWYKNGEVLLGEKNASLVMESAIENDEATFKCLVTGDCGEEMSNEINVQVDPNSVFWNNSSDNSQFIISLTENGNVLEFNVKSLSASTGEISIFDNKGLKVGSVHNGQIQEGINSFNFDTANLASGVYWIAVETNKANKYMKIQIVK